MTQAQRALENDRRPDPAGQFARLRHVLGLVGQIAGRAGSAAMPGDADEIMAAYDAASPVARRLFDTLAAETSNWASSGLDALAAVNDPGHQPRAAAARLADELEGALDAMARLLRL